MYATTFIWSPHPRWTVGSLAPFATVMHTALGWGCTHGCPAPVPSLLGVCPDMDVAITGKTREGARGTGTLFSTEPAPFHLNGLWIHSNWFIYLPTGEYLHHFSLLGLIKSVAIKYM